MKYLIAFLAIIIIRANAFSNEVKKECWRKTKHITIKISKTKELVLDRDYWKATDSGKPVHKNLHACNG
jgi:hypothetical protein